MHRSLLLCIGLAACNTVFGLHDTTVLDANTSTSDRDGDGVLDEVDNCPEVANTSQVDLDGDRIGDACDPCSFTFNPTFDRDMDGVPAATDVCPTMSNASQVDGDGDGVGDPCDPNPTTKDTMRCFADLLTNESVAAAWPIADPWKWIGTPSSGYIVHQPSTAMPFWMGARASGLAPSQLAVQIGLTLPMVPTTSVLLANGVAVGAADQTAFAACELVAQMGDSSVRLQLSDSTGALGVTTLPFTTTHLTLAYRTITGGVELTCTAHAADGQRQSLVRASTAPFSPTVLYLTATNATAAFDSVVVYTTAVP